MRPLASIDLETTGTDISRDRIVQIGVHYPNGEREPLDLLIRPPFAIPYDATQCHGITNEMVSEAPTFPEVAGRVHEALASYDLLGFNHRNFDIPLLWEEFYRAGVEWDLADVNVIDVGNLFKKLEPRTLSAAVKFYCGREHENAHRALGDAKATTSVFAGMLKRYDQLATLDNASLAAESAFDNRVDLAGKIVLNDVGVPCYSFGKNAGKPVVSDRKYAEWMVGADFPEQTKQVLRRLMSR
jgi:DNA polymerase-3 subunit epsilon